MDGKSGCLIGCTSVKERFDQSCCWHQSGQVADDALMQSTSVSSSLDWGKQSLAHKVVFGTYDASFVDCCQGLRSLVSGF
jgi:hypothetical protein